MHGLMAVIQSLWSLLTKDTTQTTSSSPLFHGIYRGRTIRTAVHESHRQSCICAGCGYCAHRCL
eukprot:7569-Eustigmatos_ZCMA.PRE.1